MRPADKGIGALLACAIVLVACGGHATGDSPRRGTSGGPARAPVRGGAARGGGHVRRSFTGDWTRFGYDSARSGVGPADTGITAADVHSLKRRVVHLDGTVDSSAIELHAIRVRRQVRDLIVMTTTYGRTIALDPGTGRKLWEFVPGDIHSYEGSFRITNATPVADPNRRYVYAAAPDGLIRKLALSTGREVRSAHWPARITLDPTHEKIASALNITGNSVLAVTGGYVGDAPPYQGHVALIDRVSGRITHVWNSLCSNRHYLIQPSSCGASDSAVWARAGAVIEPGRGRILLATGNGPFDGSSDWGDSVLELTPDARHLLHNWTPTNQAQLNSTDTDVGSAAPALLPESTGHRLVVQGGKDGHLYLLDLKRFDGTRGGAGPRLGGELQAIATPGSDLVLTQPAVWRHAGRTYVFVADDSGTTAYVLGAGRRPRLHVSWQDGTPGTSPVLAGGLLYVYDHKAGKLVIRRPIGGGILVSLEAQPGHWNSPIVVGGRIVLPTGDANDHSTSGTLDIYHRSGR